VGARSSAPVQTNRGVHPASCTMGNGSFLGVKSGRGVTLTLHPLLVPWSRESRAKTLLPLWAVRPVQSLSACTRVHFTFTLLHCHLIPPRPKYLPQHPILKHSQPTFLPQCARPSFTPIQNLRENYSSVCTFVFIFLDSKLEDKIFRTE
jgi:hypothetical protein